MSRVLVLSDTLTYTVRGLLMKFKGAGIDAEYVTPKVRELEPKIDTAELFLVYSEDNISDMAEALVYIKDRCVISDKRVMIVGTKTDHRVAEQLLTEDIIQSFYEKPVDLVKLAENVSDYLDEDSIRLRRKSILIVDDDVSYMSMIYEWLNGTYRVSVVNSGMQAITWLAKNHADLILLDYEMPVISGPKVLEMIHSEAETASIPVMFLTGKNDRDSIMSVLALKPADYILKTIKRDELREKIETFFIDQAVKGL